MKACRREKTTTNKRKKKKKKSSPPCHFAKLLPAHSCSKLPPLLCSVKRFSPVFLYQPEGGQGDQTKTTPSHPNNPPKRTRGAFWSPWWSTPRSASAHLPPATSTACIQLAATNWAAWRVAASGHNSVSHQVLLFYTFCWCEWPHKRGFFISKTQSPFILMKRMPLFPRSSPQSPQVCLLSQSPRPVSTAARQPLARAADTEPSPLSFLHSASSAEPLNLPGQWERRAGGSSSTELARTCPPLVSTPHRNYWQKGTLG